MGHATARRRNSMPVRLGGLCLLMGGIGSILSALLVFLIPGPDGITGPGSIPANVVMMLGGVLLLIGAPMLYRAQARQLGRLGLVGVVLLWVAIVLGWLVLSGVQILDVAVPGSIPHPSGDGPPPLAIIPAALSGVLILIGGVIVGIKTIRAHVFPAAVGWVILIASVLLIASIAVSSASRTLNVILTNSDTALLCAGLAWAGATLTFGRRTAEAQASLREA
jgi:hypothetical protein